MNLSLDNVFSLFVINNFNKKNDHDKNTNIPANTFNITSEATLDSDLLNYYNKKSELLSYYNKLEKITKIINSMLIYFSKGEFDLLSSILTVDFYNNLSIELDDIQYEEDADYDSIRKSTILSLQGLRQCVNQYSNMIYLKEQNSLLLQQNSILYDKGKLKEYLNQFSGMLFPEQSFTVIAATLRPEYAMYIQLHGFPEGGIFEVEKLATIIQNLGIL